MLKKPFDYLRFGYMPSFSMDLISEIKFAKKHFDFIEITLKLNLAEYTKKYLNRLKKILDNFEILGHIHWDIDLTKKTGTKKILENIEIYKFLGARKITIHPFARKGISREKTLRNNCRVLKYLASFCKKKGLQLLVESCSFTPFNLAKYFKYLLAKNSLLSITLDVGHTNSVSQKELENFLALFSKKIQHIHLHYNCNGVDHLPFLQKDKEKLKWTLNKLNNLKRKLTVDLEIFTTLKKQQPTPINSGQRPKLLLNQLKFIEKLK